MNFDRLRFVAERAEVGEEREALFAVTIPERARQLPALLRDCSGARNVTEFNYRIADASEAHVFVGIADRRPRRDRRSIARDFERARLRRRST